MAHQSSDSLLLERQMKLDRQRQILEQKRKVKHKQINTGMITASGIGHRPTSGRARKVSTDLTTTTITNSNSNNDTISVPLTNDNVTSRVSSSVPLTNDNVTSRVSSSEDVNTPTVIFVPPTNPPSLADDVIEEVNSSKSNDDRLSPIPISPVPISPVPVSPSLSTHLEEVSEELPPKLDLPPSNTERQTRLDLPAGGIERPTKLDLPAGGPPSTEKAITLSEKLSALGLTSEVTGYDSDGSDDDEISKGIKLKSSDSVNSPPVSPVYEASVQPLLTFEDPLNTNSAMSNPLDIKYRDDGLIDNLKEVVFRPPPESELIHCRITRDKQGLDKHMNPMYYLHMEKDSVRKVFLLAGNKKRKARSSYYTISIDPADLSRESSNFVAKLRSNFVGTSFLVYDNGQKPPLANVELLREELVLVNYETNVLGFKGPRKMNVVIPALDKNFQRIPVRPIVESETLLERNKNGNMTHLIQLHNKQPVWSDDTQAYVLNFHGRVTQASVKNFQLVHASDEDYVVLQFGRIADDIFTLDYRFPMCAVQAFGIALSSFDSKWACE